MDVYYPLNKKYYLLFIEWQNQKIFLLFIIDQNYLIRIAPMEFYQHYQKLKNSEWLSWTLDTNDTENVILKLSDVEKYYTNFCKVNLWPLFHNFIEQINRDWTELEHYKKVNKLFAEKAITKKRGKIWIHDYNLLLMPKYLRELGYQGKVYFFLSYFISRY